MKKLFLIVAAMFAVVSFSACSDDDNGNPLTEMRYVKEIRSSQGEIESFEYDQQHRISKYTRYAGSCSFTYDGNAVNITANSTLSRFQNKYAIRII